jgi:hypothetical protein
MVETLAESSQDLLPAIAHAKAPDRMLLILLPSPHTPVKRAGFRRSALLPALLLVPGTIGAQERPFATPRPWTAQAGTVRFESGARFSLNRRIPLSGLRGDLLELQAGAIAGVASRVEVRVEGLGWQRLAIEGRDETAPRAHDLDVSDSSTSDATDVTLSTRIRLGGAAGPLTTALQFGARLPNAGNESGLGRDETDALASLLAGWRSGALLVAAEAGFAILGSPTRSAAQNDQGRLGLLLEVQPAPKKTAFGAEVRRSFGDESPGNELATELALGGRLKLASLWGDLAYRRLWLGGHGVDSFELGLARTF